MKCFFCVVGVSWFAFNKCFCFVVSVPGMAFVKCLEEFCKSFVVLWVVPVSLLWSIFVVLLVFRNGFCCVVSVLGVAFAECFCC